MTADELVRLSAHPKVVAIGEAGLDYLLRQVAARRAGARLPHAHRGRARDRPAAGHPRARCRRRHGGDPRRGNREGRLPLHPALLFVRPQAGRSRRRTRRLRLLLRHPDLQEFSGICARSPRDVPRDRLLVETDAPYLAPMPYRGKRNEPAYVAHTAEVLAETIGVSEARDRRDHHGQCLPPVRQDAAPGRPEA